MRVLILARVSHDTSGIGRSVDEQVTEGQAWVDREGWDLVKVIREQGSASRFSTRRERAEWQEALDWIRSGRIDLLLTWESSRATRELTGYTELRDACIQFGVKWGYGGTVYDLSQRDARFRTALDAILSEDEAARTSERVQRAVRANAEMGLPHGKHLYGYRRVYDPHTKALVSVEIETETAAVVQEAARRILDGDTLYGIAKSFNERGIPPRRPARKEWRESLGWTGVAVKQMLLCSAYAGLREHRGTVVADAVWPAIISVEDFHRIKQALVSPDRRRRTPWKVTYLLSGLVDCAHPDCSARLVVTRNSSRVGPRSAPRVEYYQSYACPYFHTSVRMTHLDAIVTEHLLERIGRPDFIASLQGADSTSDSERRALLDEIAGHRAWLDQIRERAERERDLDLLFDQEKRVKPKIDAATRKLERLTQVHPLVHELAQAEDVRSAWEDLSMSAKRELIKSLILPRVRPATKRGARGIGQAIERTDIRWLYAAR